MDETLCLCAADLSGRPYLNFDMQLRRPNRPHEDTLHHLLQTVWQYNVVLRNILLEAAFKAFARALDEAAAQEERVTGVLSAKGML